MQRRKTSRFERVYERQPSDVAEVAEHVEHALTNERGFSLIRAGDIVTLILHREYHLIRDRVYPFLGIPVPPPEDLPARLHHAVATADVIGLTEMKGRTGIAERLKAYLDRHGIELPVVVTRAFVNDGLYEEGFVSQWIEQYRPLLVGRSAPGAAAQFQDLNLPALPLDNWTELPTVFHTILENYSHSQLVLVGAGIPGRVLCSWLKEQGKVAVEIGHIMDALAHPDIRNQIPKGTSWRNVFKESYLQDRQPAPDVVAPERPKKK